MIKVIALIDCVGLGYDLKADESAELSNLLAEKLIDFGYVKAAPVKKSKETKVKE